MSYPSDKATADTLSADEFNDYNFNPEFTYGEVIAAGDALYLKAADSKVYKADADNVSEVDAFVGFAKDAGVANDTKHIITPGKVITGLSSLTAGSKYYLSNTAGAISTTAGTRPIVVGVAISTTALLILSPSVFANPSANLTPTNLNSLVDAGSIALHYHKFTSGVASFSASGTQTKTINFQARLIMVFAYGKNDNASPKGTPQSSGSYDGSTNRCAGILEDGTGEMDAFNSETEAWRVRTDGASKQHSGVIENVTATAFDMTNTKTGTPTDIYLMWIALG